MGRAGGGLGVVAQVLRGAAVTPPHPPPCAGWATGPCTGRWLSRKPGALCPGAAGGCCAQHQTAPGTQGAHVSQQATYPRLLAQPCPALPCAPLTAPSMSTPMAGWNTHCHRPSQASSRFCRGKRAARHASASGRPPGSTELQAAALLGPPSTTRPTGPAPRAAAGHARPCALRLVPVAGAAGPRQAARPTSARKKQFAAQPPAHASTCNAHTRTYTHAQ